MNLALFHPKILDYAYPMSTGYFPAGIEQIETQDAAVLARVAAHPFKQFILVRGKDDQLTAANTKATLGMLDDVEIPHRYIELDGIHSFVFSRRFLMIVLPLNFR